MPFQPIAELHLLGLHIAQSAIGNLEILDVRGQADISSERKRPSTRSHRIDVNWRREPIRTQVSRIDHLQNDSVGEPQLARERSGSSGLRILVARENAVESAEQARPHPEVLVLP